MDDLNLHWDEDLRAERWATRHFPPGPEVRHALKARSDLIRRRSAAGWPDLSRDDRRLEARYDRVLEDHHAAVLAAYRAAKAAPSDSQEQE